MLTDRELADIVRPRFAEGVFALERDAFRQMRAFGLTIEDLKRGVCDASSRVAPIRRNANPRLGT